MADSRSIIWSVAALFVLGVAALGYWLWSTASGVLPEEQAGVHSQKPLTAEQKVPSSRESLWGTPRAALAEPEAVVPPGVGPWITGHCVDAASGKPLSGVQLRFVPTLPDDAKTTLPEDPPASRSAADGSFRVLSRPFQRPALLKAHHADYLASDTQLLPSLQGPDNHVRGLQVSLAPSSWAACIRGTVRDAATGSVLEGAAVRAWEIPPCGRPDQPASQDHGHRVQTGADGAFAFTGLTPGNYHLRVEMARFVTLHRSGILVRPATSTDVSPLTLTAMSFGSVRGVVQSQRERRGLPGARVLLMRVGSEHEVLTDAEGLFAFGELPAGRYALRVRFAAAESFQLMRVPPGGEVRLRVQVPDGPHRLFGRVLCDGIGLAGVEIGASPTEPATEPELGKFRGRFDWQAVSDGAGRFQIEGLPPGPYDLFLTRAQPCDAIERDGVATDREAIIEFPTPRPAIQVSGHVCDVHGKPLGGVAISTIQTTSLQVRTRTDAAGQFRLRVQPERSTSIQVSAEHPGYLLAIRGLQTDQVTTANAAPIRIDFQLVPSSRAGALRIVLTEADAARPVAGAFITAIIRSDGQRNMRRGRTDSRGEILLTGLAAGAVRVVVSHPELQFVSQTSEVLAGKTRRLNLVAGRRAAAIRSVRVLDAQGQPANRVRVYAWTPRGLYISDGVTQQGACELPGVPVGTMNLSCELAGYPRQAKQVDFAKTPKPRLRLRRGIGSVRGRVLGADGKPRDSVEVALEEAAGPGMRVQTWMTSDTKGRFAFSHLPAGSYTLSSYALGVKHTLKVGTTPVDADLRAVR